MYSKLEFVSHFVPRAVALGIAALVLSGALACHSASAASSGVSLPDPILDEHPAGKKQETAVLAGGCFWGLQAVFEHVKGVKEVTAGYAGGSVPNPTYDQVSSGDTGHAESVKIVYDPSQVTFGQLLKVYFSVATDPTELNRQGPDTGTQYRGVVFYTNPEQQKITAAYIEQVGSAKVFYRKIVTQIVPFRAFYPAEDYHQDYYRSHPDNPYIVINDAPKLAALKEQFPSLFKK